MRAISFGRRGAEVLFLQRLLNKHGASPAVVEDGIFGSLTKTAVMAYQSANTILPANGVANVSTWRRLGATISYQHQLRLVGQPNGITCWSAASTMMLGSNRSIGRNRSTIVPGGGLDMGINNIEGFVRDLGWRLINRQSSPSSLVLIAALARGPIWIALHHPITDHAVVFNAVYSDGDSSDDGTVFSVYDPYPPRFGTIYGTTYINRQVILSSVAARPHVMIQYVAGP